MEKKRDGNVCRKLNVFKNDSILGKVSFSFSLCYRILISLAVYDDLPKHQHTFLE